MKITLAEKSLPFFDGFDDSADEGADDAERLEDMKLLVSMAHLVRNEYFQPNEQK